MSTAILETAAYSPEVAVTKSEKPRYFELRTYHAPTMAQLIALHQRFAGPEVRVFHRFDSLQPLLYEHAHRRRNLTYLIPFD